MNKELYLNLIIKVGLETAILIIEGLSKTTTDAEVLAVLKTTKTSEQYLAEEDARRKAIGTLR
jgi:hypothetical protein